MRYILLVILLASANVGAVNNIESRKIYGPCVLRFDRPQHLKKSDAWIYQVEIPSNTFVTIFMTDKAIKDAEYREQKSLKYK